MRITGPRGSSVVLHLRRFMPNTGDFSHVFRTRIHRNFPIQSTTIIQHGSTVQMQTQDTNVSLHDDSVSFADPPLSHISGPVDSQYFKESHANIDVSNQASCFSKVHCTELV